MKYILSCVVAAIAMLILLEPAAVRTAVGTAVSSCLEVIIPSLFAFTAVAVYLQNSGLYRIVLKPLTKPLSVLMRLDEELCAVFILGNIGGYPVGGRLISELVRQGRLSRYDAGRLLCFCYGSGPSFVISIVGERVFGSAAAGGVIFVACFLSSFVIGVFVCRCGEQIRLSKAEVQTDLSSGCFVASVMSAARVMLTVCAMIVGFSVVTAAADITGLAAVVGGMLEHMGMGASSHHVLPSLLEISRIQFLCPDINLIAPLCGALLSLGGVCVLLQISAVTAGSVPLKPFVLSRLPAMGLSALFSCAAVSWCGHHAEYIPASGVLSAQLFSVNAGMSVCVVVMCVILLATDSRRTGKP